MGFNDREDDLARRLKEAEKLLRDVAGILAWATGTSFRLGEKRWTKRINKWIDDRQDYRFKHQDSSPEVNV